MRVMRVLMEKETGDVKKMRQENGAGMQMNGKGNGSGSAGNWADEQQSGKSCQGQVNSSGR